MRTVLLPAAVAGLFVAILAAVVVAFVQWAGSVAVLAPMLRNPLTLMMALVSLLYVALAAWIASTLSARGGNRRAGLAAGWLASAPGLVAIGTAAAELGGLVGPLDPGTLAGQVLEPLLNLTLLAAFLLPFSAGPLVFAVGFPLAVIVLGAVRLVRGRA